MQSCEENDRLTTVYYDGSCPLCSAEVAYYKRADTEQSLGFVDVSSDAFEGDAQLSRQDAMARFHIRLADGRQASGARAFVAVWQAIPSWQWVARLARLPGVTPLLDGAYRVFLWVRPTVVWAFWCLRLLRRKR